MHPFYVSLGSNKPLARRSPADLVMLGFEALDAIGEPVALSPLYRSDAWPDPSAPAYVNAVGWGWTPLGPEAVLAALLSIESGFSRTRSEDPALRYAPRTLDLDLLACGTMVVETERLTIPHPRLAERAFVLAPLVDVAPDWRHPVTGDLAANLQALVGTEGVHRLPHLGGGVVAGSKDG